MKEKLIIKNFGPIRHVELELGRFNVLIGEQATGKSTVAKVLAVCRYFSYITQGQINHPSENKFWEGLAAWDINNFIQKDSFISYQNRHYSLEIKKVHLEYPVYDETGEYELHSEDLFLPSVTPITSDFKKLLDEFNQLRYNYYEELRDSSYVSPNLFSFYQSAVARVMENPFFLPAERGLQSIFSLGKSSIQNLSDALFNQLANIDQVARLFKNETAIEPLDITYQNVDGKGFVRKKGEAKYFSLFNAATGYQSLIPVVLLTKYYSEVRKKTKTFIIEEPELNLFPTAQQRTVQFLVGQMVDNGHSFLVTTHSPYILTSLNNLIYAHEVGQSQSKEVEEIVPRKYWLNKDEFSAYMMLPDGTCENIMDEELSSIKVEKIDDISDQLSKDWHKLAELEFSQEK